MHESGVTGDPLAAILTSERGRLVGLCAHLVGDREIAEDLAQEVLVEAWRNRHKITDPAGAAPWLSAIARNVCLRWRSGPGRAVPQTSPPPDSRVEEEQFAWHGSLATACDIELELERHELATLLDRALELLPPETRAALVARYIEESPHAEIAVRLGVGVGAVKMRLRRGTLALRRVLTTELSAEAIAHGLVAPTDDGWRETRLWCPICGERQLNGRFGGAVPELTLRCPRCCPGPAPALDIAHGKGAALFGGVKGYKPALSRLSAWAHRHYRDGLATGTVPCGRCGRATALRLGLPDDLQHAPWHGRGIHLRCDHCGATSHTALASLVLNLPAAQRFWRHHPRMRMLPDREIEAGGRAAIVTAFEDATGAGRLAILSARDDLAVLGIDDAG